MKKIISNQILVLGLILVVGLLLRLYKIDNPVADWHSWRQADTASVSWEYYKNGINILYPKYHDLSFLQTGVDNPQGYRFVEFPLYNVIHALLNHVYPVWGIDMWGRLLSTFSSLVSVVLIFFLGRRFLGFAGGVLSSLFFAILPFNIYFSRVILPEPMSVMFALASILFFAYWIDDKKQKNLIISAVSFSCALLVKPHALFLGVPLLWLAIHEFGIRKILFEKKLWLFAVIAFLPTGLWRVWMSQFPEGIPHFSWMFNADSLRFKPAFWRWLFGERLGHLILGGWGLIIFAIGFIAKVKQSEKRMIHIMCLSSFIYLSVIAAANIRHDYYQSFIIPAVCLCLAKGVLVLWNSDFFNKTATRLLTIISIIFMLGLSWYQVKEFYKINHPEIVRAGQAVDRLVPKDAKVLAPYNGDTALLYQTRRSGWPYLTYAIEQMIQNGAEYYVSVNPKNSETQDAYRKFIILEETPEYIILKLEPKPVQP